MSLNVYTIKHPLILNWVNHLNHNELTLADKYDIVNKIGISLIYEATRRSIKLNHLYLKQPNAIVEVNIIPRQVDYLIFTDIYLSQILSKDIINLIPLSNIHPISDSLNSNSIFLQTHKVINNTNKHNIIIIKESIDKNKIINMIEQILSLCPKKNLRNIQVCCITCTTSTLQFLGHRYPNLNIYTTQIINDNNN